MSLLAQYATPAERIRRCFFAEAFENVSETTQNGGAITSTPQISNGKYVSNGSSYIKYYHYNRYIDGATYLSVVLNDITVPSIGAGSNKLISTSTGTAGLNIHWEYISGNIVFAFLPSIATAGYFTVTAGTKHNITVVYDGSLSGNSNKLKIYDNGTLQSLSFVGTIPATIETGTYMTIGATPGGSSILSSGAIVGATKLFNVALTATEASDYANNSTFNYNEKAVMNLPMGADEHNLNTYNVASSSSELLVDGNMEAVGTTAWTAYSSAVLSKEGDAHSGSQCLRITHGGTNNPGCSQAVLTSGTYYHVTGWARGDGSLGTPKVTNGTNTYWTGTNSTSWQYFDVTYAATASNSAFFGSNLSGAGYVEFDDCSAIESASILNDGDMESAGVTAWALTGSPTVTKDASAHSGTQSLKIVLSASAEGVYQTVLTTGKYYRITGWMKSDGTAYPYIACSITLFLGSLSTDWQYFDFVFPAATTALGFRGSGVATTYVFFDDITVTEVRANTQDRSGKGNNALLGTDGVTASKFPSKLQRKGYLCTAASSQQFTAPSTVNVTSASAWTISFAINLLPSAVNNRRVIVQTNSSTDGIRMTRVNTTSTLRTVTFDGGVNTGTVDSSALGEGNIRVVTLTNDGTTMTVFVDGIQSNQDTSATYSATTNTMSICAGDGVPVDAEIYDLKIWYQALTPLQIIDNYLKTMQSINEV